MKRPCAFAFVSVALLVLTWAAPWQQAAGQSYGLAEQVKGTWAYVAVDTVRPDGTREHMYGDNPKGVAVFDGAGQYILLTARNDISKFASNNRMAGTAEEYRAVVQGSIAHFGRYSVDEAARTITFEINSSTFPNWNGTVQKRPFAVSGDELRWQTPGSNGGLAEVVLRRAR
jgi:hypothetical protein